MERCKDLIFDIGLHKGEDTTFYLKKGFRVIAVEANPTLCDAAREKFSEEIASGQLTLVNGCISDEGGTVDFFVNNQVSEWSSFDKELGSRQFGSTKIEVPSVSTLDLFAEHGVPYYMKIDIEGADGIPVRELWKTRERPVYVSYEAATIETAAILFCLGYRRFAVARQRAVPDTRLPNPATEGEYVDYTFPLGSSGAFGTEVNGRWGSLEDCAREHVVVKYLYRDIPGHPNDWADIHAFSYKEAQGFGLV
ncbi:FkbM family methyltransferase [Rhodobacteraceae bacterium NNCM2]|nr:FkbM family methyltransferase [Coraliihabitans acroporae]